MSSDYRRGIAWSLGAAMCSGVFVIPWKLANEVGDPAISLPLEAMILGYFPPVHELLGGAIMLAGIAIPLVRPREPRQAEGASSPNPETRSR